MEMRLFEIGFGIISIIFMFMLSFGSSDDFGYDHPSEEYATVFKNIPIVFEHLLQMLEEKPEVLEKDDISVFNKRQAEYYDKTGEKNESEDERSDRERETRAIDENTKGNKNYKEHEEYYHDTKEEDNIESDDMSYSDENYLNDDFYKDDPKDMTDMKKEELTQPVQNKLFSLTSDEIAEQSIIIEQMLEKQNSKERLI